MEAPNEVRTRDLTLTKRMLCQLSYKGTSGGVNPPCNPGAAQCCDSDYGSDQRRHVRRDSIGAITSRCGRENLGATPSLGTFFFFFAAIIFFRNPALRFNGKTSPRYSVHCGRRRSLLTPLTPEEKIALQSGQKLIGVGFEPTPPKRPVPETGALDRSAIQPPSARAIPWATATALGRGIFSSQATPTVTSARIAQLVERKTLNLVVVGSSPTVKSCC